MRKEENGKLQQVICNGCGKELKIENEIVREGCFAADVRFGYFSRKDGLRHRFDLCEDCYDKWIHTLPFRWKKCRRQSFYRQKEQKDAA